MRIQYVPGVISVLSLLIAIMAIVSLGSVSGGPTPFGGSLSAPVDPVDVDGITVNSASLSLNGSSILCAGILDNDDAGIMEILGTVTNGLVDSPRTLTYPTEPAPGQLLYVQDDNSLKLKLANGTTLDVLIPVALPGRMTHAQMTPGLDAIIFLYDELNIGSDTEIFIIRNTNGSWTSNTTFNRLTNDIYHQKDPSLSSDGRFIHFASNEDGGNYSDIYRMEIDGSNVTQLTFDDHHQASPVLSDDGDAIVFSSRQDGGTFTDIWVMGPEGDNPIWLTRENLDQEVLDERDGSILLRQVNNGQVSLAMTTYSAGEPISFADPVSFLNVGTDRGVVQTDVGTWFAIDMITVSIHPISFSGSEAGSLMSLSSDDSRVIYQDVDGLGVVADLTFSSAPRVDPYITFTPGASIEWPTFSPDDGMIAYSKMVDGSWDLCTRELAVLSDENCRVEGQNAIMPRFSSDGSSILFSSQGDGHDFFDIWEYNLGNGTLTQRTTSNYNELFATPTPTGDGFMFTSAELDSLEMGLMVHIPGRGTLGIPNLAGVQHSSPTFSGTSLVYLAGDVMIQVDLDRDLDGYLLYDDPFPTDTTEWSDTDWDGFGDNNDPDDDDDGHLDATDAFPLDKGEWRDSDGDGMGDVSDPDDDNDGYSDELEVRWGTSPFLGSSRPPDNDDDGIPDGDDPDDDNDGVDDSWDVFPLDPYEWYDNDDDGLGDNGDGDDDDDSVLDIDEPAGFSHYSDGKNKTILFSFDPKEWSDTDGDGIGDNGDLDDDGDGILDTDFDRDGLGDNIDPDIDNDGYLNGDDDYDDDPSRHERPATTLALENGMEIPLEGMLAVIGSFVAGYFGMRYRRMRFINLQSDMNKVTSLEGFSPVNKRIRRLVEKNKISAQHLIELEKLESRCRSDIYQKIVDGTHDLATLDKHEELLDDDILENRLQHTHALKVRSFLLDARDRLEGGEDSTEYGPEDEMDGSGESEEDSAAGSGEGEEDGGSEDGGNV